MVTLNQSSADAPKGSVYVFVSDDEAACAFSTQPDGSNVPAYSSGGHWMRRDAISMTRESIERYVFDAEIAIANLRAKGYHLSRLCIQASTYRAKATSSG